VNAIAVAASALALAAGVGDAVRYVEGRQSEAGAFAEPGGQPTPGLTAWAVIGLRAAGIPAGELDEARAYLARADGSMSATDLELVLIARASLGERPEALIARVRSLARADGAIGPTVNSTIWGVLALRAAGEPVPRQSLRFLLRQQRRSGGWSWSAQAAADSNDTAAAIQALRAAGARGAPIRRGIAYLRRLQNADGGFELTAGRGSDVQSTAWAIQAFLAAGTNPGAGAYRYLERMQRPDGSLRYSARYAVTPLWVTAQALPALARRPLPLR
jgi:Prenyltransferase and squalene oxidase repeat